MILYNITINIDLSVRDEWLKWMKEIHIPEVLATKLFIENKICKIHAEEKGGTSYSIQYLAKNKEDYDLYQKKHAPALQQKHIEKYKNKFGAFRTVLEVIHTAKP